MTEIPEPSNILRFPDIKSETEPEKTNTPAALFQAEYKNQLKTVLTQYYTELFLSNNSIQTETERIVSQIMRSLWSSPKIDINALLNEKYVENNHTMQGWNQIIRDISQEIINHFEHSDIYISWQMERNIAVLDGLIDHINTKN